MATGTPFPVKPAFHASGAPICGTLWSSAACTFPSSHSFCTPAASARAPVPPRTACQNAVAVGFLTRVAMIPSFANETLFCASGNTAGRAPAGPVSSNGMSARCASS
ncbi:hypothetical protein [Fodinicola feengrottensis]|uniref:hypothetical protein n=1 Tax=Fodinicola feengrottensis TaxID=435914 RepID=UPI0024418341|nr:hypothetical protein [Fodinicola feengrottensis]